MKIAFFSDNFYPELSGIVDSILITGKELQRRGHEVVFIGPRYTKREYDIGRREYPATGKDDQYEGMPFVRLPSLPLPYSPTGQSRLALPTGASFAHLDAFKPDIVHAQSPYGCGFEALRAAKRYKAPLVGTNHTDVEEFYPFAPNAMRTFDAWYYNHCKLLTTPYQLLIDRMRQKGFRKPARVQSNPIELPLYYPASLEEKIKLKAELGLFGPVVLYCGRLAIEKRVDVVLRGIALLVKEFPSLTFVATGHGAESKKLLSLARALGIEKNARFTGFVSHDDLPRWYRAADAFALMSTSDSQSLALMQALASGLPAVGARSKGLPDYLHSDCGYLVEPGDIAGFARHMGRILRDGDARQRMAAAGVGFVRQFSPARVADAWEKHYGEASSAPGRS